MVQMSQVSPWPAILGSVAPHSSVFWQISTPSIWSPCSWQLKWLSNRRPPARVIAAAVVRATADPSECYPLNALCTFRRAAICAKRPCHRRRPSVRPESGIGIVSSSAVSSLHSWIPWIISPSTICLLLSHSHLVFVECSPETSAREEERERSRWEMSRIR